MHTDDVKALADRLGYTTVIVSVGPLKGVTELRFIIDLKSQEALARGALEWVEERAQERADKIISGDFLPWETGALPVPLPLYLRGTVCPICHKEVSIKLDSETGKYIAVESCDCVKEEPK